MNAAFVLWLFGGRWAVVVNFNDCHSMSYNCPVCYYQFPFDGLNYGCISHPQSDVCGPIDMAASIKHYVSTYAPQRSIPLEVQVTEYNMEQPFGPQTWQLLEGIFLAKFLGESMTASIAGNCFFALANGKNPDYGCFCLCSVLAPLIL